MRFKVDLEKLHAADNIIGEDDEETGLLNIMYNNAVDYINSFSWCPPIEKVYFGFGVGGVVAVFLFHFRKPINGKDKWLWVIEGDIPSAYLVLDKSHDPVTALKEYCKLMTGWANAIIDGKELKNKFPVEAKPTKVNAFDLLRRIRFITTKILPIYKSKWINT
jgi:hypothetical protein